MMSKSNAHESKDGNSQTEPAARRRSVDPRLARAIVNWHFGPEEWRKFLDFDRQKRQKQDSRETLVIFGVIALALVIFFFVSQDAFAAILIFAGIIALAILLHFFFQGQRQEQMETFGSDGGGEIYITPGGIWANGVWFDWGEGTAWRLVALTPVLADTGIRLPPGVPGYIEFKCRGRAAGRHRATVDKKWRVPVPYGKETEAREIVRFFGVSSVTRDEFGLPDD